MNSYEVHWYHQVPPHVKEILHTLHNKGRTAYIVGGAVRDLWMGKIPKDFDLVSDASVEMIAEFFPKTLELGKKFGIMVVVTPGGNVEVARFRSDGAYTDSRHPNEVKFTTPENDAQRRDFTINALFYDIQSNCLLDHVGGVEDLKSGLIRTVGDAQTRFEEDSLRMLRALRFQAQLGFQLHEDIFPAIIELHENINHVSRERVSQESTKALEGEFFINYFTGLIQCKLWDSVLLFSPPNITTLSAQLQKIQSTLQNKDPDQITKILSLLYYWYPTFPVKKSFHLSKVKMDEIEKIKNQLVSLSKYSALSLIEKKKTLGLNTANLAISMATALIEPLNIELILKDKFQWEQLELLNPTPLLQGNDLITLGVLPGPKIREILQILETKQLEEKILDKKSAIDWVKENFLSPQ